VTDNFFIGILQTLSSWRAECEKNY